ncbi:MAG: sugar ABC transporter permease [Spirochaetaceae bacterium]|jgi:raffinose/stachyose/melibiose transport system permease protein|nr:sugar ABC transporter permease [Spirochaetaceae bacterium]
MADHITVKRRYIALYLALPIAVFLFAVAVPLFEALYFSFFKWSGGPNMTFTGLANFAALVKDRLFWQAFSHNIFLVIACVVGQIGLAFIFVMIISAKCVKLKDLHSTFTFFPSTISAVAIGMVWRIIFDYRYGLLNYMLRVFGMEDAQKIWLNEADIIMTVVSIPLIWQYIGYYMIILLSAITTIDKEIYEVAELDGAGPIRRALHITIPLIKNTLLICVTLCIAGNMKAFDHIYVMTAGGPGSSSNVMAMYGYITSFVQSNMGYGSAISMGIFILSLLIIGITQILTKQLTKEAE